MAAISLVAVKFININQFSTRMEYIKDVAVTLKQKKPSSGINASFPKKSCEENRSHLRAFLERSILSFISSELVLVHSCEVQDADDANGLPRINVHIKYAPLEVLHVSYDIFRTNIYSKRDDGSERLVKQGQSYRELGDLMCRVAGETVEERFDILAEGPWDAFEGKAVSYSIARAESSKK